MQCKKKKGNCVVFINTFKKAKQNASFSINVFFKQRDLLIREENEKRERKKLHGCHTTLKQDTTKTYQLFIIIFYKLYYKSPCVLLPTDRDHVNLD